MADYSTPRNLPACLTIDDFEIDTDTPINIRLKDCMLVLFFRKEDRKSQAYYQAFRRASVDAGPKFRMMDFSASQNVELLNLFSNQAQYNTTGSAFAYGAVRTPTILAYQKGKPVGFFNTRHMSRKGSEFSAQDLVTYANNLACRADYYEPFQQERTNRLANNVHVVTPRSQTVRGKSYDRPYSSQLNRGTPVGLTDRQIRTIEQGGSGPSVSDRSVLAPTELSLTGDVPIGTGTETTPTITQIQSEVVREQQEQLRKTPVIYASPTSSIASSPVLGDGLSPTSIQSPISSPIASYASPTLSVPTASYASPSLSVPTASYAAPSLSVPTASYASPSLSVPTASYAAPSLSVPTASYAAPSLSYGSPALAVPSATYSSTGVGYTSPGSLSYPQGPQSPLLGSYPSPTTGYYDPGYYDPGYYPDGYSFSPSGYQVSDIGSLPVISSTPTAYSYPYPGQTGTPIYTSPPSYTVVRSAPLPTQTGYASIPSSTSPYR